MQSLLRDLETGNVAHAYLFTGKRYLGKFTMAKWFAEQLLTVDAEGEERERLEHQARRLLHPDLLVIDQLWIEDLCEDFDVIARSSNVPQQHRAKAGAKTDIISIDDIRSLQERLHETGGGRYRCCLIRSAERMREEAVNALLKILEEPPPGVVFVLTTQSRSLLLPTLVSRARVVHFSALPMHELVPLAEGMAPDDARFLLRLAQGAPGVVVRLRGDPDGIRAERQRYASALAFWRATALAERLKLLEPLQDRDDGAQQFLTHLALALREERPADLPGREKAFSELVRDLRTNASRSLLAQRFALAVS